MIPRTPAAHRSLRRAEDELGTKIVGPFTVAAVGDLILPQPLARSDARFTTLTAHLQAADVGFANMESSLVDFEAIPGPISGTAAPLAVGESIRDMGITLMSRANNHTWDCGLAGMLSTNQALTALGIAHAGTGMNLQEARAARFQETPKGRVGLVSCYSVADKGNFGPTYAKTLATAQTGLMAGAPGVNPLHLTCYNVVSPVQLDGLKALATEIYGERPGAYVPAGKDHGARFRFFDEWYEAGDDPGALRYEMNPSDLDGLLSSIRSGKTMSDFLIATIHSHQGARFDADVSFPGSGNAGLKEPPEHEAPDFLVAFARAAIDAGADMFVTHGIHALAGIEIYNGRPIFYGLSNFIFQFGLQVGAGYDAFANFSKKSELEHPACHEAVLAVCDWDEGALRSVRLHPADLGGTHRPLSQVGIPLVPAPEVASRILGDLKTYSAPFGTGIEIKDGVGQVSL